MHPPGGIAYGLLPALAALIAAAPLAFLPAPAAGHVTPPLVLMSQRDAVGTLAGDTEHLAVRGVRLTPEQAEAIQERTGWTPEPSQRFYVSRGSEGALRRAIVFLTEYTVHGMLRVAVALTPEGRVADARIVEVSEESYRWVEPLVKKGFTETLEGKRPGDPFTPTGRFAKSRLSSMEHFYAEQTATLVHRATILFDIAFDRTPPPPPSPDPDPDSSAATTPQ